MVGSGALVGLRFDRKISNQSCKIVGVGNSGTAPAVRYSVHLSRALQILSFGVFAQKVEMGKF